MIFGVSSLIIKAVPIKPSGILVPSVFISKMNTLYNDKFLIGTTFIIKLDTPKFSGHMRVKKPLPHSRHGTPGRRLVPTRS